MVIVDLDSGLTLPMTWVGLDLNAAITKAKEILGP